MILHADSGCSMSKGGVKSAMRYTFNDVYLIVLNAQTVFGWVTMR
ncbi:MAG: hypothetical protein ACSLEL_00230 [Candidatus Malihini olakiniferum]